MLNLDFFIFVIDPIAVAGCLAWARSFSVQTFALTSVLLVVALAMFAVAVPDVTTFYVAPLAAHGFETFAVPYAGAACAAAVALGHYLGIKPWAYVPFAAFLASCGSSLGYWIA